MRQVTVGLGLHRPEMLPLMAASMRRHDAVFLEEPPTPGFDRMLRGDLAADDYLMPTDMEYPAFSRDMCFLLRDLHAGGKPIYQVEPFIEILLSIHEFFAEGHAPDDLKRDTIQYHVYRAERAATGALLAYYQCAVAGSFDETLEAVIHFARADAARFRLRDSLRAQALAALIPSHRSSYVESGLIHYPLGRLLRNRLPTAARVKSFFLADGALKTMGLKGHLYGPGDQLTLLYMFHPAREARARDRLLAARALVYSKILEKQEINADPGAFPHLRDELACTATVRHLSLEDCRRLFPLIRTASSLEARQRVAAYLAGPTPASPMAVHLPGLV